MIPLKVTFHLGTAMVPPPHPIHLDALLSYAIIDRRLRSIAAGDEVVAGETPVSELAADLPLARSSRTVGEESLFVWQASALLPGDCIGHSMRVLTSKTDVVDYSVRYAKGEIGSNRTLKEPMEPFAHKIDTNAGLLKNAYQLYPVKDIRVMTAFCVVPDDEAVEEIMALLHPSSGYLVGIGARYRLGHGRLDDVTFEEDETALERWKLRVLPWEEEGYAPVVAASKPPYWDVKNREISFIPPEILI